MKKLVLLVMAGMITSSIIAQELPQPSPLSKVEQRVGVTDFTIEYSRPSVKGRVIFGELVPYDKVWRLGANACTKLTSSTDFMFGKTAVKAGTYALFAIPSKGGEWTMILNSDTEQWGAGNYDEAKNIASVKVMTKATSHTESFLIYMDGIGAGKGSIIIAWDKLKVEVPFTINTEEIVKSNIKAAIEKGEDLEKVYYKAASYTFKVLNKNQDALVYLEKSYAVNRTHNAVFLEAQIFKADGKKDEAIKKAEDALKLAQAAEKEGWVTYISETIEEWKK